MTKPPAIRPKRSEKGRIRPALATAVRLIVTEALSIQDAANRVGMQRESLSRALTKPHVQALRAGVKRAWLENETGKAWLQVARLADAAQSEDVRLKASKLILDAAGELTPRDLEGRINRPSVQIIISSPHGESPPQQLPGVIEARVHHVRPADQDGFIEAPRA